jgi:hypothetical protein
MAAARRGDRDAKPGEFSMDAAVTPRRVLASEANDRVSGFDRGGWSAGPVRIGPVVRNESSMPRQDRARLHQEDPASRPSTRANAATIARSAGSKRGRGTLAFEDRELVAQYEDLDVLGPVSASTQHQQVDEESDETVEASHGVDPGRHEADPNQTGARSTRSTHRPSIRHPHPGLEQHSAHGYDNVFSQEGGTLLPSCSRPGGFRLRAASTRSWHDRVRSL